MVFKFPVLRNKKYLGGQPSFNGYKLSIGRLVLGIQDNGLKKIMNYYKIPENDKELVKNAVKYCTREKCIENSTMDSKYCDICSKSQEGGASPIWIYAKSVYRNTRWGSLQKTYKP